MWIVRDVVMIGFAVGLMPVSVDAEIDLIHYNRIEREV